MSDLPGQTIGNCKIEALLGSGGMGRVYRAHHIHLRRPQAIKLMHDTVARDPNFQARFMREARTLAALDHDNIVEIFDCGEDQGYYFLSMELLPDGSLRGLLERRVKQGQVWSTAFSLDLVRQAADALAYAHSRGVVHRDIKPDNLLLARRRLPDGSSVFTVKVSDFGLAQIADGSGLTASGVTVGTPAYMSPEQCQGLELDARTDIYSLGVVLYEILTGYLPFAARTITDVVRKHIREEPRSPRELVPSLPAPVEALVMRCLAKRPEDRFAGASELSAALRALVEGDTGLGRTPTPAPAPAGFQVRVVDAHGQTLQVLPLSAQGLTIGRAAGNDLILEDQAISRSHLRIGLGRTRARATDLGTRNGTLLDGLQLPPHSERPWAIGQPLQLGPFTLQLEASSAAAAPISVEVPPGQRSLTLTPGQPAFVSVALRNQSPQRQRLVLGVEGLPAEWVQLPQEALEVEAGASLTIALCIAVPPAPAGRAGDYAVTLRARSDSNPRVEGAAQSRWRVLPVAAGRLVVAPAELTAAEEGTFALRLSNDGNQPARYRLSVAEPSGSLSHALAHAEVEVLPGETAEVGLTVRAGRRLIGRRRSYGFTVRAEGPGAALETTATFVQDGPLLF